MNSLDSLIARYSLSFQPRSPLLSLGGAGGFSGARLWRYHAEHGEFVVRSWPMEGPGRGHIEQVHHWLSLTTALPFIPVPIRDRTGRTVQQWQGSFWEIAPWLAGSADTSRPPKTLRVRLAFAGLAAFHQQLACEEIESYSAGLRQRQDEIGRLVGSGFDLLESTIGEREGSRLSNGAKAIQWLALARQIAPAVIERLSRESGRLMRVQPVIRDARPEHFLFDLDRLSGLVDFGAMGVESVAADLARLTGEWFDGDPELHREGLRAYESIRPLDPDEAHLIAVFEVASALLIGERWARWHYIERRHFDDPFAVSKGLDRGLARLQRLASDTIGLRLSL
jgi:hypothetical protein